MVLKWVLGTAEEVEREDVMVAIVTDGHFDDLVQIADLYPPATVGPPFVADANKDAILVEANLCSPIGMVEVVEDFVPSHQRHSWQRW